MSDTFLAQGSKGMLIADGRRVAVEIVDYCGKALRVRFVEKALVGGSPWCWLDFENGTSHARFYTQVCAATFDVADGLVLVRVPCLERNGVREFARVPVQMSITANDEHGRRHVMEVLNVSSGGALLESTDELPLRAAVTLEFNLPGGGAFAVGGQIMHVDKGADDIRRYGLRFVEFERAFLSALLDFLWQRLRELFPSRPRVT